MLDQITPLILTYNEASNIERTLAQLTWAHEIIVVDSFSDDTTISILEKFKQVRIFQRKFDWHATQWNYGLRETGIETEWVLALDADYVLTNRLIRELNTQNLPTNVVGFRAGFTYCVFGKPLRGSLYPPVTVLFRKDKAEYIQDGHTQRVILNGDLKSLNGKILHDDRKSLSHWLSAQDRYIKLEAEMLSKKKWHQLGWTDRIRKLLFLMPFGIFIYLLLVKGIVLDGRAGIYYGLQRMLSETLLSLRLLEIDLPSLKLRS